MSTHLAHTCGSSSPVSSPDSTMLTSSPSQPDFTYLLHQTSCLACNVLTNATLDALICDAPPPSPDQGQTAKPNGSDPALHQAIQASLLTLHAQNRSQPSSNLIEDYMMSGARSPGIPHYTAAERRNTKTRRNREEPLDAMARGEWDSDFEPDALSDWEEAPNDPQVTTTRPPPPTTRARPPPPPAAVTAPTATSSQVSAAPAPGLYIRGDDGVDHGGMMAVSIRPGYCATASNGASFDPQWLQLTPLIPLGLLAQPGPAARAAGAGGEHRGQQQLLELGASRIPADGRGADVDCDQRVRDLGSIARQLGDVVMKLGEVSRQLARGQRDGKGSEGQGR